MKIRKRSNTHFFQKQFVGEMTVSSLYLRIIPVQEIYDFYFSGSMNRKLLGLWSNACTLCESCPDDFAKKEGHNLRGNIQAIKEKFDSLEKDPSNPNKIKKATKDYDVRTGILERAVAEDEIYGFTVTHKV